MNNYLWKKKVIDHEIQLPERDAKVLDIYTRRMKKFDEMVKLIVMKRRILIVTNEIEFIPIFACQCELPRTIKRRMLYHVSIDFLLGLIPILGIFLDMLYRAHSKNARILRRFLYERARQNNTTKKAANDALNIEKEDDKKHPRLSEPTSLLMEKDRQNQINKFE
ncbi:MAG: hypothetical protein EXX96DRAFT_543769 [Benjaminiella poitrasii]|nr:MAG: hypothetical protein EXX96DRAFT_543769 [Benjaminiella poitrasii]